MFVLPETERGGRPQKRARTTAGFHGGTTFVLRRMFVLQEEERLGGSKRSRRQVFPGVVFHTFLQSQPQYRS